MGKLSVKKVILVLFSLALFIEVIYATSEGMWFIPIVILSLAITAGCVGAFMMHRQRKEIATEKSIIPFD